MWGVLLVPRAHALQEHSAITPVQGRHTRQLSSGEEDAAASLLLPSFFHAAPKQEKLFKRSHVQETPTQHLPAAETQMTNESEQL